MANKKGKSPTKVWGFSYLRKFVAPFEEAAHCGPSVGNIISGNYLASFSGRS